MRDFIASLASLLVLLGGLVLCFFLALYDEVAGTATPVAAIANEPLAPERLAEAA